MKEWTEKDLLNEAKKYSNKSKFLDGSTYAYKALYKKGMLDKACSHMAQNIIWNYDSLLELAIKYERRIDFSRNERSAYMAAQRRGIINEICSHMETTLVSWTTKMLHEEALKYKFRKDFEMGSKSAYSTAQKRGLLNSVCSHMEDRTTCDDDVVYIWKSGFIGNKHPVYKIGATSARLEHQRIERVSSMAKTSAELIVMINVGKNKAKSIEATLLKIGEKVNVGEFGGSTEFREMDNLQLKKCISIVRKVCPFWKIDDDFSHISEW